MQPAEVFQSLLQERPALGTALKQCTAHFNDEARAAMNGVLAEMLGMQLSIMSKRDRAKSLLLLRSGNADGDRYAMRHIPDVTIRSLCDIAEVPFLTNASPEWLDKMEAKHAND